MFSLGGLDENGKNMFVIEVDKNIFVFEAGLKYADELTLGIDYIIPNVTYLKENKKRIKGIFLTHGHDENIGALTDIVDDLGIKTKEFVTPSLVIYKDGELEDMVSGFQTPDMLFDFLQKNSIISAEANMYINYLDLDKYKEIIQSKEPQIIALGSYSSEESNTTQVELWKVAKENNIKINYLSLSTLTEKEGADFESTLSFFSENEVSIPMIIVVKNGEVIASSLETFDTEGYINFFKENGLM